MASNAKIKVGSELMLPGAKKIIPKPKYVAPKKTYAKTNSKSKINGNGGYKFADLASSKYSTTKGTYQLKWRKPYSGAAGNCTWFVASHKNVNWRGNANQWLRNARAKGHPTGMTPKLGSIVSLNGRGYNRRYGHVAIVTQVKAKTLIVADMNYRRLYEVTYREIPRNDRAIQGYIYVD